MKRISPGKKYGLVIVLQMDATAIVNAGKSAFVFAERGEEHSLAGYTSQQMFTDTE